MDVSDRDTRDALFIEMRRRGDTVAQISAVLGVGRTTLGKMRARLDLPRRARYARRWSEERRKDFRRQWREGISQRAIASDYGISVSAIDRWRRKLDLPKRRAKEAKKRRLIFFLSEPVFQAMQRAAFGRYATNADYVRALIRRDTGASDETGDAE
jgi:transposase